MLYLQYLSVVSVLIKQKVYNDEVCHWKMHLLYKEQTRVLICVLY
jgi:hypothetical protein